MTALSCLTFSVLVASPKQPDCDGGRLTHPYDSCCFRVTQPGLRRQHLGVLREICTGGWRTGGTSRAARRIRIQYEGRCHDALLTTSTSARFLTGAADPKQADLVFLQELIDAGKLRTVIGRRYTLDEIAEAHRYADTGHKIGNVAVLIGNQTEHPRAVPVHIRPDLLNSP